MLQLQWSLLKIAQSGRRKRKFSSFTWKKRIIPEARKMIEANMLTVVSGGKSYSAAVSTEKVFNR